jgi:hypothetical protein
MGDCKCQLKDDTITHDLSEPSKTARRRKLSRPPRSIVELARDRRSRKCHRRGAGSASVTLTRGYAMDRLRHHLKSPCRALLAVVVVGLLPVAADAAGIYFRNETNQTIYVRGCSIVNGMIVRGPLMTIPPGKIMMDVNVPKGDRYIKITDSANRVLFDEARPFDGTDTFFGVVPLMQMKGPPRVILDKRMIPMQQ